MGWGGVRGQKQVCVPKISLKLPAPLINFIFCLGKIFLVWVGGLVGRGCRPPPPPGPEAIAWCHCVVCPVSHYCSISRCHGIVPPHHRVWPMAMAVPHDRVGTLSTTCPHTLCHQTMQQYLVITLCCRTAPPTPIRVGSANISGHPGAHVVALVVHFACYLGWREDREHYLGGFEACLADPPKGGLRSELLWAACPKAARNATETPSVLHESCAWWMNSPGPTSARQWFWR